MSDEDQQSTAADVSEQKPKRTRKPAAAKPATKLAAAKTAAKSVAGKPVAKSTAAKTTRATSTRATRAKVAEAAPAEGSASAVAREAATGEAAAPATATAPTKRERRTVEPRTLPRLQARYRGEIKGQLFQEFGYTSTMQVPEIKKVVINIGLGEGLTNAKAMETAPSHIATISGQKPVITKARRSIAGFKIREGQSIGTMVTLRGRRMYEFVDRLISMALPRIRDFRGVSRTAFDGNGNYSLGLREQIMFPEIDYASVDRVRGLQITITTSARTDPEGFRLLELMGMPFAREGQAR